MTRTSMGGGERLQSEVDSSQVRCRLGCRQDATASLTLSLSLYIYIYVCMYVCMYIYIYIYISAADGIVGNTALGLWMDR